MKNSFLLGYLLALDPWGFLSFLACLLGILDGCYRWEVFGVDVRQFDHFATITREFCLLFHINSLSDRLIHSRLGLLLVLVAVAIELSEFLDH